MMTHKERMLSVMRGEMVDKIPFVPRLDLWWLSNSTKGTLPEKFKGMGPDEIAKSQGWACYHMIPDLTAVGGPEGMLHRAIGLFHLKSSVWDWKFSADIDVNVQNKEGVNTIEYHTPLGMVRTVGGVTEESKRAGSNLGWVQEHAIKKPEDYKVLGYIFENMEIFRQYESAQVFFDGVGEDGVVAANGPSAAASPMHMIQKEFIDATQFFYEYQDHPKEMGELAESLEIYFNKILAVIEGSPAEVVLWGANYDDMLTYPPYFEKEIAPWLRKASETLEAKGKIVATHTDGENYGLMDLIRDSGAHVAESLTPHPMTRVRIEEYYERWGNKLTLMGCIPESILLEDTATDEEFEAFLDNLFACVAPGDRLILGPADSTPPEAKFERLCRIADRVEEEGRLPLTAGAARPLTEDTLAEAAARVVPVAALEKEFKAVMEDVMTGDGDSLMTRAQQLLDRGVLAQDVLHKGMIPAMENIGERFKAGNVFIPEVLLSARAMNEALAVLEPHLAGDKQEEGFRVLIGTVQGDMHDIGKNMVATMLRGVGFETRDMGINVATDEFVRQVKAYKPHILGISALLTTTMPKIKDVIRALEEAGLRDKVKIIIGGAPVNQKFAQETGADEYGKDAGEAVQVVKRLLELRDTKAFPIGQ